MNTRERVALERAALAAEKDVQKLGVVFAEKLQRILVKHKLPKKYQRKLIIAGTGGALIALALQDGMSKEDLLAALGATYDGVRAGRRTAR